MAARDFPTSYKDPAYASLDAATEQKLGLPDGLLAAVRTRGERSNHDQVSEDNARSVYQFIPATRKAILEKYGIDALLSPANASEAAGLLLKEGLDRNKGDPALAVAEFHGGTDRSNWGNKTKAYVQRVIGAVPAAVRDPQPSTTTTLPPGADPMQPTPAGQSTFDRVSAALGRPSESAIANVYKAYSSGQMEPQDEQQFEEDVKAGRLMLPPGAFIKIDGQDLSKGSAGGGTALPDGVVQAYTSGRMSAADRIELERDVRAGLVKMPAGVEVYDSTPTGSRSRLEQMERALINADKAGDTDAARKLTAAILSARREAAPTGIIDRVKALPGQVVEAVTGSQRTTPKTEAAPDWSEMPEFGHVSMAAFKSALGTLMSSPDESAQIVKANFPGVEVTRDDKGNYWFKSGENGQLYAMKPGFRLSDAPRAAGAVAAFTPAGRATSLLGMAGAAGATQAVIEGTQAATGGEFNSGEVATAAALAPVIPAVVSGVRAAAQPVKQLAARVRGLPQPVAGAMESPAGAAGQAAAAAPESLPPVPQSAAPVAPAAPMAAADLAQTAKKAAGGGLGSKGATETLAAQAAPDAKVLESAKRLGIEEYLQPDHVTTNQAYRELAQAVKSIPGSEGRAAEMQGLAKVGERADKLISDIGGTTDLSTLDSGVKRNLQAVQAELQSRGDDLYAKVRETIPARTEAPASNVLDFIEQRAKDLDGKENLSPMEKRILARLSPKATTTTETVPGNPLMPGSMRDSTRAVTTQRQPTYTLLDDVRKDVGAAARMAGPFKDADTGLAKKLYGLITKDQEAVVGAHGMAEIYDAAKRAVVARKGIEDDLVALFGKQLDGSLVRDLSGAVRALPQGDASRFIKLLQVVPPEMRQEVTASGLATAFRTAGTRGPISFGQFEKWYDGLLRNKQAHAALMSNLPPQARRQITDLYRVSRGISAASRERITTGRIMAVQDQFKAPDTLAGKLYEAARRGAVGATVGTAVTPILGPGVGAAMASALTKGAKPAADKAVDALIASPEFLRLARAGAGAEQTAAARKFASGEAFKRFMRSIGGPRELSDRERWVMQAMQAGRASAEPLPQ